MDELPFEVLVYIIGLGFRDANLLLALRLVSRGVSAAAADASKAFSLTVLVPTSCIIDGKWFRGTIVVRNLMSDAEARAVLQGLPNAKLIGIDNARLTDAGVALLATCPFIQYVNWVD